MENFPTINTISEYSHFRAKVGSRSFVDSFIITADTVISPWLRESKLSISSSDLLPLLALDVDFLLVGT